tara:strand:- start:101 stop:373 length:273 start_codon:yes stop_codon:yes gene_type:complete
MEIIRRTQENEERCTRKGDLPIEQQRLVAGELEDIVSIHTYDHTETIEFIDSKGKFEVGDKLDKESAYRDYIVIGKNCSPNRPTIYTAEG